MMVKNIRQLRRLESRLDGMTPSPQNLFPGERVRAFRRLLKIARGWSLPRMAEELGISPGYLKMIERGERKVTPRVAKALAELERDEAYCFREQDELDAATRDWLITALERHAGELTLKDRSRLNALARMRE